MNPDVIEQTTQGIWGPLLTQPFIYTCFILASLIITIKRALKQWRPAFYASGPVKALFTLAYPLSGFLAAIPKYLPGKTYFERAILGVFASALAFVVHYALFKRLASAMGVKNTDQFADPDSDVTAAPAASVSAAAPPPSPEATPTPPGSVP